MLLYPFFVLVSFLVPRDKKLWVFGCHKGLVDNTKYFFDYCAKEGIYNSVWLANNEDEKSKIEALGFKSVLKKSPKGYWISSRAGITFICTGYSDVNRVLALGSKVINFWHGTPIKKIYLDSIHDLNRFGNNKFARFVSKSLMLFLNRRVSLYYASNEFERKLVGKAAGFLPERTAALGVPRYDEIRKKAATDVLLPLRQQYKKFILYAPTWREHGEWGEQSKISPSQYEDLCNRLVAIHGVLIVKRHPLTTLDELIALGLKKSERVIYTDDLGISDINSLYPHIDLLVTDISSAMYDVLIFNKPVVLFMPDLSTYLNGDRGIYDYFKKTLESDALQTWSELASNLDKTGQSIEILKQISSEVEASSTESCKAIYNDILKRFY